MAKLNKRQLSKLITVGHRVWNSLNPGDTMNYSCGNFIIYIGYNDIDIISSKTGEVLLTLTKTYIGGEL